MRVCRKYLILLTVAITMGLASGVGVAQTTPPEGAVVFDAPPAPLPGTTFYYRNDRGRTTRKITKDTSPFNGRAAYRMSQSGRSIIRVWDAETHNLLGVTNRSGKKVIRYYTPHESEFNWPLWVGKKSHTSFTQVVSGKGERRKTGVVTVEAMETLKIPAGTFETMRLRVEVRGWKPLTVWRARDIPVFVKFRNNRFTRVLTRIKLPKK